MPTFKENEAPGKSIQQIIVNAEKINENKGANLASETQAFTEKELRECWIKYIENIPEKKIVVDAMKNGIMILNKDYSIDFAVVNESQNEWLIKEAPELLTFLSQTLKNGAIKLNIRVSEKGENKNTLSNQELFNELIKRNKNIAQLYKRFRLEVE